ncbi:hypothetical protein CKA32_004729 [Geitlerinema sp. FC II]|nr:hypothetical protein CKA32_004729 [Geitlerinema sp. FC II]
MEDRTNETQTDFNKPMSIDTPQLSRCGDSWFNDKTYIFDP